MSAIECEEKRRNRAESFALLREVRLEVTPNITILLDSSSPSMMN